MSLSPQVEVFCRAIVGGLSQSDAYRKAFPKSLKWKADSVHNKASAMMRVEQVKARISSLKARVEEKVCLDSAAIQEEIRRLAHSDIAGIMTDKGVVKMPHELDPVTRSAVASFKIDEYGRIEYKFWDKNAALEKAAKIKRLYQDENEQAKTSIQVNIIQLVGLAPLGEVIDANG